MADLVWWVQILGGVFSAILMAGGIITGVYAGVRGTPRFIRQLSGVNVLESKIDQLLADHETGQHLQHQQAQAFNELQKTVCEHHEIPAEERPSGMNTEEIQRHLLDHDQPDFTQD